MGFADLPGMTAMTGLVASLGTRGDASVSFGCTMSIDDRTPRLRSNR
jgi:hypothetical protein